MKTINLFWPAYWPDGGVLNGSIVVAATITLTNLYSAYSPATWANATMTISGVVGEPGWPADYLAALSHRQLTRQTVTDVQLVAGGPALPGAYQLIRLLVSAAAYSDNGLAHEVAYYDTYPYTGFEVPGDLPLPASAVQVLGQPVTPTTTNAYVGELYVSLPAGATKNLPVNVTGTNSRNYSFNIQPEAVNFQLTVVSNSATQIDGTNWAVVKSSAANDYVYVQAMLDTTNAAALAMTGRAMQWTGGEAVPGNPLQRRASKTNSVETTITARLNSTSAKLNVWVIWATVTIQTSGTNTSPLHFVNYDFPDEQLGLLNYNYTSLGIFPAALFSYTNMVAGKVCIVATITPAGVHNLITNDWDFIQKKNTTLFTNGVLASLNPAWTSDGPDFVGQNKTVIPDINDKLYSIDGPNLNLYNQNLVSVETYKNFYDYITWKNQVCCDTNNFWYYEARWKTNLVPQFTLTSTGTGSINVQTSAYYP